MGMAEKSEEKSEYSEMIADFYNGLIEKKIPSDIAIQLTLGWWAAMLKAYMEKNREKGSELMVDWLSKTSGGVGN